MDKPTCLGCRRLDRRVKALVDAMVERYVLLDRLRSHLDGEPIRSPEAEELISEIDNAIHG